MKKWLAGITAAVIAGVLVFWLTDGRKLSHPQTAIDQRSNDVSGRWETGRGVSFYFSQKGDTISYYIIYESGVKGADGHGTISGHFIELVDQYIVSKCKLSTDEQRMECSWTSPPQGGWKGMWYMRSGGTDKMTLYRK